MCWDEIRVIRSERHGRSNDYKQIFDRPHCWKMGLAAEKAHVGLNLDFEVANRARLKLKWQSDAKHQFGCFVWFDINTL